MLSSTPALARRHRRAEPTVIRCDGDGKTLPSPAGVPFRAACPAPQGLASRSEFTCLYTATGAAGRELAAAMPAGFARFAPVREVVDGISCRRLNGLYALNAAAHASLLLPADNLQGELAALARHVPTIRKKETIMSSIGSIAGGTAAWQNLERPAAPRPRGNGWRTVCAPGHQCQGYLQKSDLQAAFDKLRRNPPPRRRTWTVCSRPLDADSDGKGHETGILRHPRPGPWTSRAKPGHVVAHGGAMQAEADPAACRPRPGGGGDDRGIHQGRTAGPVEQGRFLDSARTTLISGWWNNFDAADTDGDGKVSSAGDGYAQSAGISPDARAAPRHQNPGRRPHREPGIKYGADPAPDPCIMEWAGPSKPIPGR